MGILKQIVKVKKATISGN